MGGVAAATDDDFILPRKGRLHRETSMFYFTWDYYSKPATINFLQTVRRSNSGRANGIEVLGNSGCTVF